MGGGSLSGHRTLSAALLIAMTASCDVPENYVTVKTTRQAASTTNGVVDMPTASPPAEIYTSAQSVTLTSATAGAKIYYTTDGSAPSIGSNVYSTAINVSSSMTIKAFATKTNFSDSAIASNSYTINGAVAVPVASVVTGTFNNDQSVTLATVPMAASIYYTLDGSAPTPSSTPYTGTISISRSTTLKAMAVMANFIDSGVMTETYTMTAATPTADIPAGAYGPTQTITLSSATAGAVVYYTTDGSTPTCSSATGSIDVLTNVTIKAIACKNNYNSSAVVSFAYTINGQVATPTMSVVTGTYNNDQSVTLSSTTPEVTIYYTTDTSTPTTASNIYSSPINVSSTQTILAYATKANFIDSDVIGESYDMVVSDPVSNIFPDYQYFSAQSLTLSSPTTGAVVHYTTDESSPTCDSMTGPLQVSSNIYVQAIACKPGYADSQVTGFSFFVSSITSTAIEAFPDTTSYPNISWEPSVNFSISKDLTNSIQFYSDTIGTSISNSEWPSMGTSSVWLNKETSLGVTKNVYVKSDSGNEYIPMGSYSTKLPASFTHLRLDGYVYAMVIDSVSPGCTTGQGCIILAGLFNYTANQKVGKILKIKPDGSIDTLGGGLNSVVYALAIDASGNIYAGGSFTCQSGSTSSGTYPSNACAGSGGTTVLNNIAKWNGASWSALGSGMDSTVRALAFDGSGNLYAGGFFATAGGVSANRIAKWSGASWSALGTEVNNSVYALASDSSGNIYAGGSFTTAGGVSVNRIAKWNGGSWSALGTGVNANVSALALDSSGKLYAAGTFTCAGGSSSSGTYPTNTCAGSGGAAVYNRIAQWNGTSWIALGSGINNTVAALAIDSSGNLYTGGTFNTAGGAAASGVAKWNGTSWSALGSGANGTNALAIDPAGNLYAGTSSSYAGGMPSVNYAVKWSGTSWSPLTSNVDGQVVALAKDTSGSIYAGGSFKTTGTVAANYIARWDGDAWSGFGSGMNNIVKALAVDSQTIGCTTSGNPCLYAGGDFTTAGGSAANYIAKWNGSSWSALGSGMNGQVSALVMDTSGNLYVAGNFTTADGLAVNYVAKWNGASWSALGSGMNGQVNSLAVDSAGNLFAGGVFTTAGGVAANYIAKWNGSTWSNLGSGMSGSGSVGVYALATDSSGNLYAGGGFTTAGGVMASNVAQWNGTAWSSLGGGLSTLSGATSISSLVIDSTGKLYAGGAFTAASLTQLDTTTTASTKTITLPSVAGLDIGMSCSGSNVSNCSIADINTVTNVVTLGYAANLSGATTLSFYWPRSYISKWDGSSWQRFYNSDIRLPMEPNSQISSLMIDNSGNLYAGGNFTTAGYNRSSWYFNFRPFLAKWMPLFSQWF